MLLKKVNLLSMLLMPYRLGAFIVARMLLEEQESHAAQENLADLRDRQASNPLVKFLRPFFTQYVVPMIRGKPFLGEDARILEEKLLQRV